jgi:hypothetical protein
MYPRKKFMILAAPLFLCDLNRSILLSRWLNQSRVGDRSGSIKDQKSSKADEYGLAPFDPAKHLTKLTSWDALSLETEAEEIKPLLACIQELKNATKTELNGTQLIVFFLQR